MLLVTTSTSRPSRSSTAAASAHRSSLSTGLWSLLHMYIASMPLEYRLLIDLAPSSISGLWSRAVGPPRNSHSVLFHSHMSLR
eukprot:COSAG06_NODE_14272_length_1171_cov_1.455732_2_plen_83_part_00